MLKEYPSRQVPGNHRRRWFTDDYFDLYIWYEADGTIHGFQLCYGKPAGERALTWTCEGGCWHAGIDSGESAPFSNPAPILVVNSDFPAQKVLREFLARGATVEDELRAVILARLEEYVTTCTDFGSSSGH